MVDDRDQRRIDRPWSDRSQARKDVVGANLEAAGSNSATWSNLEQLGACYVVLNGGRGVFAPRGAELGASAIHEAFVHARAFAWCVRERRW